jgi:hypothetical protein
MPPLADAMGATATVAPVKAVARLARVNSLFNSILDFLLGKI